MTTDDYVRTGRAVERSLRDTAELPDDYRSLTIVDLKGKRFSLVVQGIFLLTAVIAVGAVVLSGLSVGSDWPLPVALPVTLVACLGYMAIHEVTHGVALQLLTAMKPTYAVRFPFLTTGNNAYLTRRSAAVVALAPSALWGSVLILAFFVVPHDIRLIVYVVLALNFAGSAGDYVEAYVVSRQQADALVQDDGDLIHIYVPRKLGDAQGTGPR